MGHPRSPILELENAIAGAAFRIAPERERELAEFRDSHAVTIALHDGPGFMFQVSPARHEISTTVASLEYLWSSAHAQAVLYHEYGKAQRSGEKLFDTGGNPRRRAAMELYNWATRNLDGSGTDPWPALLPRPERFPEHGTDLHVTNELFLCSVAWILHHELGHLRLGHPAIRSNRSLLEEKEADIAATRWILEGSTVPGESRKRTLGVATAILAIQGIERPAASSILDTHPRAFERIDYCLNAAGVREDDEVYAFAACTMQIQLASRGTNLAPDSKTFRELLSEYLVAFSREGRDA